jgi:hypothetical protein
MQWMDRNPFERPLVRVEARQRNAGVNFLAGQSGAFERDVPHKKEKREPCKPCCVPE